MPGRTRVITSDEHEAFQEECHAKLYDPEAELRAETGKRGANALRRNVFRLLGNGHDPAAHRGMIDGASLRRVTIFRYDAVGDYVVTSSLIRWLRQALPQARIDVIASQRNETFARADPNVDRVFTVHDQNTLLHSSLVELMRTIGPRDSDLLFALPTNRMTRCAVLGRIITPRAEKISLLHRPRRHIYGEVFHRQLDRPLGGEHWSQTFLRMATETINPVVDVPPQTIRPYLVLDEKGWQGAEAFMRREGLGFRGIGEDIIPGRGWSGPLPEAFAGDRYCIVNISAHCSERQWAPERCAEAVRALAGRHPELRYFISGAPADAADVRRVVELVGHPRCSALSMRLSEFVALVAGAALVISPDTATVHMAAAAGRPVVGLYAEEIKAAEWHPFGTKFTLLVSPSVLSINLIEPELVADAASAMIQAETVGGVGIFD